MAMNWVLGGTLLFAVIIMEMEMEMGGVAGHPSCGFPAIYTFGDNNSDTGQHAAMFADVGLPNGQTFFGGPSGRYCDGRLIIDFIAENLGFPHLTAYLDSYKTNFRHGANFALGGAAVRLDHGYSHLNLQRQVFQFAQFKSRTTALFNQLGSDSKNQSLKSILPRPEDFLKALFIIDVGQNDFAFDFENSKEKETKNNISDMVYGIVDSVVVFFLHGLYEAKHFLIQNVGPLGCLPYNAGSYKRRNPSAALDQNGCVKEMNDIVQEFNRQLKLKVAEVRKANPNITITYVDVYTAKYNLISNAKNLGFEDPMKFCCGSYNDGHYIRCGDKDSKGTLIGSACNDPSKFISWDGIHYSEAANKLVSKHILNGSLSDPPLPYAEACRL